MAWPTLKGFAQTALAALKLFASIGTTIFSINAGLKWLAKNDNVMRHTWYGQTLATIGLLASFGNNYITKFKGMNRAKRLSDTTSVILEDPESNPSIKNLPNVKNNSCGKSGIYGFIYGSSYIYLVYSGLGGYLSGFSISEFLSDMCHDVSSECSNEKNHGTVVLVIIKLFELSLLGANIYYFYSINRNRIFNDYLPWFLNAKCKTQQTISDETKIDSSAKENHHSQQLTINITQVKWYVFVLTSVNLFLQACTSHLSNVGTAKDLNEETFAPMHLPSFLQAQGLTIFDVFGIGSGLFINILMGLPSMHRLVTSDIRETVGDYSKSAPSYYRYRALIYTSILVDSLLIGFLGTSASVASFIQTFFGDEEKNLQNHWGIIGIGMLCGSIGTTMMFANSREAYWYEIQARKDELEKLSTSNDSNANSNSPDSPPQPNLKTRLLAESNSNSEDSEYKEEPKKCWPLSTCCKIKFFSPNNPSRQAVRKYNSTQDEIDITISELTSPDQTRRVSNAS